MNQYIKVPLKLIWTHFLCAILSIFFMYPFGWLLQKDSGILIYSYIVSLTYFAFIYSDLWEIANKDKKSYSENKPYVSKGLLLGTLGSVLNIIMVAIYYLSRPEVMDLSIMVAGEKIYIVNIIYRLWMSMFIGFFETYEQVHPWVYAVVLLVMPIASFLGYIAGMHKFSIQDKLAFLFYKKSPKKKD